MTLSYPVTSSSPNNSFTTKQAFGKATARAKKIIPIPIPILVLGGIS